MAQFLVKKCLDTEMYRLFHALKDAMLKKGSNKLTPEEKDKIVNESTNLLEIRKDVFKHLELAVELPPIGEPKIPEIDSIGQLLALH